MTKAIATVLAYIIVWGGFIGLACLLAFGYFQFIREASRHDD